MPSSSSQVDKRNCFIRTFHEPQNYDYSIGWGYLWKRGPKPDWLQMLHTETILNEKCQRIIGKKIHISQMCTSTKFGTKVN